MCTAISFKTKHHYFGRNLDLHHHYNEAVVITPRRYSFRFSNGDTLNTHNAFIGIATVANDYPLYYDAVNEHGLAIAGLNFPGNAVYHSACPDMLNISSYELIPRLLSQCRSVMEVEDLLVNANVTNTPFSTDLPTTPLHWLICDSKKSIAVESVADGLKIYENSVGILTNNPPFPYHMQNLNNYLNLTSEEPTNRFSNEISLEPYSLGMGAIGLPGDFSSASRFIRAAFTKLNAICNQDEFSSVSQFFHILDSVSQPTGCIRINKGLMKTIYSCCCNTDLGIYYYTSYDNRQITAVCLKDIYRDGKDLVVFPLRWEQNICYE